MKYFEFEFIRKNISTKITSFAPHPHAALKMALHEYIEFQEPVRYLMDGFKVQLIHAENEKKTSPN